MYCDDCNGCTDDECPGCDYRWCGGMYMDGICNRCPNKVPKEIQNHPASPLMIQVRCNADDGHSGICHWDPWKAGR